jgi:hypothetical protein
MGDKIVPLCSVITPTVELPFDRVVTLSNQYQNSEGILHRPVSGAKEAFVLYCIL